MKAGKKNSLALHLLNLLCFDSLTDRWQ